MRRRLRWLRAAGTSCGVPVMVLAMGPLFMPVTQSIGKENNIEVTPWFHLTPDLQIVESARTAVDTVYITGIRAVLDF